MVRVMKNRYDVVSGVKDDFLHKISHRFFTFQQPIDSFYTFHTIYTLKPFSFGFPIFFLYIICS